MSDDLDYVRAHVPGYRDYGDEAARHDTDMRVRAFVGERLSAAQARLGPELDERAMAAVEAVLLRCMFTDQVFIRTFEHAKLEPAIAAALVREDRTLVDLAERLSTVSIVELPEILRLLDAQFDARRAPVPVPSEDAAPA